MLIVKHTVETKASPEEIWDIWQDVSNWNTWDHGIEFSRINGPFEAGTTGTLKPKGGPLLHTMLTAVEPMKMFIDESRLPFTRIIVSHFMNRSNGKTQVTHQIEMKGLLVLCQPLNFGLGCVKASGLRDRKWACIANTSPFTISQPRELSRSPIRNLKVDRALALLFAFLIGRTMKKNLPKEMRAMIEKAEKHTNMKKLS